jgi:hypothetical protein
MSPRGRTRAPGGVGEQIRRRHSWLELLQTSGPFLTLPVVHRVFENGLPPVPQHDRARIRGLIAAMLDDSGASRHTVIETMLYDVLDWQDHLRIDDAVPQSLAELVADHGVWVRPDFGFYAEDADDEEDDDTGEDDEAESGEDADDDDGDANTEAALPAHGSGPWKLLGTYLPWGTHPLTRITTGNWAASPVERLAVLLRARDVPIGLVTDGRWWALVWAPRGGTAGAAVWDASLFSEESVSLQALVALVNRARFLAAASPDRLPAMLRESLERQEEVTETLGRQVREAVEMLVTVLDRLDREASGALLAGADDDELYAGVVTVMMRVVFLLFAEERRLLPSDDDLYVTAYSVSHLVDQLERHASLQGEQTLEYRTAAWHRLLALTRAVYAGVAHEDLRLPAYGGGLFDPDRYPWLEGRTEGVPAAAARPPAVDDRTVLRMLRAVQYVNIGGERRRLTFRALDVEQIGYVYEGLLELEVRTADDVVLGLARPPRWPQKIKHDTEVPLAEATVRLGTPELTQWLADRTGWTGKRIQSAVAGSIDSERAGALRREISDPALADAITPFLGLLRYDELGRPAVTLPGGRYVTRSSRRAATGTHYTPRSLAEEVAEGALQPLVYRPGPLETSDSSTWRPRPSSEIEQLRVADIAMGSGAFLVAACRYLADRLVEAWQAEGRADALAMELHRTAGRLGADAEAEHILLDARRLIAEHCLYGVDINPLAVEMAKLSMWLITMDRERPFGFLDDRLACGDSLLGLVSLDQLETLHIDPAEGRRMHHGTLDFTEGWRSRLAEAADLRRRITTAPVVTIRDIEHKSRLLAQAEKLSGTLTLVGNAVTATGVAASKLGGKKLDAAFLELSVKVSNAMEDGPAKLESYVDEHLQQHRPPGTIARQPLNWPLAFPEVFADAPTPGFDAIIGNPPFLGGQKISGTLGDDYLGWLQRWDGNEVKGSADLAARFVLRGDRLISARGQLGYVTVNTLIEGPTMRVGLEQVTNHGLTIRQGRSPHPWPTVSANLQIVELWASQASLTKTAIYWLDGEEVPAIGPDLQPYGRVRGRPESLRENGQVAFQGTNVLGMGFTLTPEQADDLIRRNQRNADVLQPFIIGKDLSQRPDCSASRWVINFHNWPLERAERYVDCMEIVRRLVKPERDRNKIANRRERWWIYGVRAPELYEAIDGLGFILALSRHGSTLLPVREPTGAVFSDATVVIALDDFASLAILSSSVHSTWALRYSGTIRTDVRYSPSDVFLTLPRPQPTAELEPLGRQLDETRRELMLSRSWGLTSTYNRVHDPDCHDAAVREIRELHAEIDDAVMRAYGWDDLDLKIGHHPTKIGIRWTVSKEARFELLDRLLEENHRRYKLEHP